MGPGGVSTRIAPARGVPDKARCGEADGSAGPVPQDAAKPAHGTNGAAGSRIDSVDEAPAALMSLTSGD